MTENLEVAVASRMTAQRRLVATRKRHGPLHDFLHLAHLDGKALVPAAELAHGEKRWYEIAMLLASEVQR